MEETKQTSTSTLLSHRWGKLKGLLRPFFGLLLTATESLMVTVMSSLVKSLKHINVSTMIFVRCLVCVVLFSVVLVRQGQSPVPKGSLIWFVLLRSVLVIVSIYIVFFAVQLVPLADVAMISGTSTIFVPIFARIFLKEAITLLHVINVLLVIGGIVFIVKPPFIFGSGAAALYTSGSNPNMLYSFASLVAVCTIMVPGIYIVMRRTKDSPLAQMLFGNNLVGILLVLAIGSAMEFLKSGFLQWEVFFDYSATDYLLLVVLGLLAFGGQTLVSIATQLESAATVATTKIGFDIIYSFIAQIAIFHDMPTALSLVGFGLIITALFLQGTIIVLDDRLPFDHPWRTKYLKHFLSQIPDTAEARVTRRFSIVSQYSVALEA